MLALALLLAADATIHIAGKVVDAETKKPIDEAVVIVMDPATAPESNRVAVSDREGRFEVDAPLGTYLVVIQASDYLPFERTETRTGSTNDWVAVLSRDHKCDPPDPPDAYDRLTSSKDTAGLHWLKAFHRLFASSAPATSRIGVEFFSLPTAYGTEQAIRVQGGPRGEASVVALRFDQPLHSLVSKFLYDYEGMEAYDVVVARAWGTAVPRLHVETAPLSPMTATRLEQLWQSALRAAEDSVPACGAADMHDVGKVYVLGNRAASVPASQSRGESRMAALLEVANQLSDFAGAPGRERAAREGRLLDAIDALLMRFDDTEARRQHAPKAKPH